MCCINIAFLFLLSDQDTLPAHAVILAAASPVINTDLGGFDGGHLEYNTIDTDTWNNLLTYVYSGKVRYHVYHFYH